jgi:HEAT repeat protein
MEKTINDLIEDLKDDDDFVVAEACGLLEMRSEESLDSLIDALKNKNKNIRLNATKILGLIGNSKAIDPLIQVLYDNNKLVRREASTTLSRMGKDAVDPLISVLNDDDWKVRGAAAWALGNIKDKKALPFLEKLTNDESAFVKLGAQNAIANIENM